MEDRSPPSAEEEKNILSKKIEQHKKRQGQKIDSKIDETDAKIDKTVDKAVDKTLDKVFKGLGGLFD